MGQQGHSTGTRALEGSSCHIPSWSLPLEPVDPRAGLPQAKQLPGRECNHTNQQIIRLKFYWARPCPSEQDLVFPVCGSEVKGSACNAGDLGLIPGSGRSPGEGNSNPHQYSCLENPMDGGAWWATAHGVTKSLHDWATSLSLSLSNQEAYIILLASPIRGQTEEARSTVSWQLKQKPYYRKSITMKKQKVMFQIKGQDKTPEKQLNKVEIGSPPEKELRIMIVKMIQDLRKQWRQRLRRCKRCLPKT